ncbi:Major intracellular serine protease [Trichoderma lentiforme]|uniref:Major intracellular serine protease n=1 Tax=Trichoderma lentiforme TaxID=1567552 RepID=A0A9P4XL03_9HYPO|nr:Major intracellular serine protease [Trichoderma lentiforme]
MWQLELLSWVIPAFGALAKEFMDSGRDPDLFPSAQDCYSDIIGIGLALSTSHGEWAPGLEDKQIGRLLKALESRLPKSWMPLFFSMTDKLHAGNIEHVESKKFPGLHELAKSIQAHGLGGYDECSELLGHSTERRDQYLSLVGRNSLLFHKKEKDSETERAKFLKRVRGAKEHLLNVYFRPPCGVDAEEFDLSRHPSYGMKDLANKTYGLLERHWKCHCVQRASAPSGLREARLSLTIHRGLAPKVVPQGSTTHHRPQIKFEILLPLCKDDIEWKVTNVEVVKSRPEASTSRDRQYVNNDICHWLLKSRYFQVDFLVQNDKLWHLTPRPFQGADHHTHMESLQQLLGDGVSVSDISKYKPKDKLILCYVLASSMLFLYPGSWFQTAWSSDKIYFARRFGNSTSSGFTFPYLSTTFQQVQNNPRNHMQYHYHPAILGLGIIFLEIATSVKFTRRSHEPTQWQQFNSDGVQALEQLQELERQMDRDHSKRIPRVLNQVIRSCLILDPPPNFPTKQLSEEGPIRQYILSCIVKPLESNLRDGYNVSLDNMKLAAEAWFEWHTDALNRIEKLRKPEATEPRRVKIAILDSGIELSKDQKDMYDVEPKIKYRSWIEEDTEWKDDVGHGTHLAVLLRKIAPNAGIHVARVFKKRPHVEKSAQIIAEAIRHAVDGWKVDIIVMSFGFGSRNEIVYDAIKHAAFNDVLMFVAASNEGKNRPGGVAWPAIESNVICVHSGDGYGNQSSFTPSPKENMRLMVLGECVRSAWPPKLKLPGDVKDMSGTSCAAPIAAGVAAVILDYARGFLSQQEWGTLHRTDSMRRMFERLKDPDNHTGYWWVQHWGLFDSNRDESWIQGEIKGFLV